MVTHGKQLAHYGNVVWLNANMRTDASTKRKHTTQALNASTKPKHITQALTLPPNASTQLKHTTQALTQALMGATRLASEKEATISRIHIFLFSLPRRETRRPH